MQFNSERQFNDQSERTSMWPPNGTGGTGGIGGSPERRRGVLAIVGGSVALVAIIIGIGLAIAPERGSARADDARGTPPDEARVASRIGAEYVGSVTLAGWASGMTWDGGELFVTAGLHAAAYDAKGKTIWEVPVPTGTQPEPVAVTAGVMVVQTVEGFFGLDRSTGATRWSRPVPQPGDLGDDAGHPAAGADLVVFGVGGRVAAYDPDTGVQRWGTDTPGTVSAQPAIDGATHSVAVVWHSYDEVGGELIMLEASDGSVRWRAELAYGVSAPLISDGLVIVGDGERRYRAFDIADGTPRWEVPTKGAFEPSMLGTARDGVTYFADRLSVMSAIETSSGRLLWQVDLNDGLVDSNPSVGRRHVAVTTFNGRIVALDRSTGRVVTDIAPTGFPTQASFGPDGLLHVAMRWTEPGRVDSWRLGTMPLD